MTKYKPYKDLTEQEKQIYNYDRRQNRTKQAEFERRKVLSCSKLGFSDIDFLTENVVERLSAKVSENHNHRPNLFRDDEL